MLQHSPAPFRHVRPSSVPTTGFVIMKTFFAKVITPLFYQIFRRCLSYSNKFFVDKKTNKNNIDW